MDRFRDWFVRVAFVLALAVPVYFLIAAMGTRFGLMDWTVGFVQMTVQWGPLVLAGVAVFALIALLTAFFTPPRRGMGLAFLALLIPAGGLGYGLYIRQQAAVIPPIHDISTDLMDPPGFSRDVATARSGVTRGNDLDLLGARVADDPRAGRWAGARVVDVIQRDYPDITSIPTGLAQAAAFEIALNLAREQNWRIGRTDPAAGIIEATERSLWYGFTDDIVVRVRPDGSGARIDMRSVSRVGGSDLGMNAKRMRPYLAELRTRLEASESR